MKENQDLSFEKAYERLEMILEKLNSGEIPLDDSVRLYEEADLLMIHCQKKLTSAEQKIQTLIKNRSGELVLNTQGEPEQKSFQPSSEQYLKRDLT